MSDWMESFAKAVHEAAESDRDPERHDPRGTWTLGRSRSIELNGVAVVYIERESIKPQTFVLTSAEADRLAERIVDLLNESEPAE